MSINAKNEKLYNIRAALPDHQQIFQRWAIESGSCRKRLQAVSQLDVVYGQAPRQRLDLFFASAAKAPLYIFLHGGYWQAMDKSFFSFLALAFIEAGCSLAVVNYSLCPQVALPDIVEEVKQALKWLSQQGDQYDYDGGKLHLSGHSAGGHLTAMMMSDEEVAPLLSSGLSISGLFNLRPLVMTSINDQLGLDRQTATDNSPAFRPPLTNAPLVLCVGELESRSFHDQSDLLASKWRSQHSRIDRLDLADCNHLTALDRLADPQSEVFSLACALMT